MHLCYVSRDDALCTQPMAGGGSMQVAPEKQWEREGGVGGPCSQQSGEPGQQCSWVPTEQHRLCGLPVLKHIRPWHPPWCLAEARWVPCTGWLAPAPFTSADGGVRSTPSHSWGSQVGEAGGCIRASSAPVLLAPLCTSSKTYQG